VRQKELPLPKAEYWVVRVCRDRWGHIHYADLNESQQKSLMTFVDRGMMMISPTDGAVCDPVDCFDDQETATNCSVAFAQKYPDDEFRVVLTADIS